jgi:hypothetical protein
MNFVFFPLKGRLHLGCHVLKPGDFADISGSKVLHFAQSVGLLNA